MNCENQEFHKFPSFNNIIISKRNRIVGGKLVRPAITCRVCFWPATRKRLPTPAIAEQYKWATLDLNPCLTKRVLGVGLLWNANRDFFWFKVCATLPTILTRRRVLSAIFSLYDRLGVAASVLNVEKFFARTLWKGFVRRWNSFGSGRNMATLTSQPFSRSRNRVP